VGTFAGVATVIAEMGKIELAEVGAAAGSRAFERGRAYARGSRRGESRQAAIAGPGQMPVLTRS
jgi:hypothetical protein